MKRKAALFLIFIFVFSFHAPVFAKKEVASALDKRAVQTKIYDTKSETELMKMALNVIQDEDYKIINLDNDLSLITVNKQLRQPRPLGVKIGYYTGALLYTGMTFGIGAIVAWVWIKDAHTPYYIERDVTLNVSDLSKGQRKIRINTLEKVFATNTGSPKMLKSIGETNNSFYQDFFIKMDKESFINKQDL